MHGFGALSADVPANGLQLLGDRLVVKLLGSYTGGTQGAMHEACGV